MFESEFLYRLNAFWICLIFFVSIILMGQIGVWAGRKFYFEKEGQSNVDRKNLKALETGLFGIFGFLLAFIFNFTATRYDKTKMILLDEANAIGSAVIMSDLYQAEDKNYFLTNFRQYLETVIHIYQLEEKGTNLDSLEASLRSTSRKIWFRASHLSSDRKLHMASRNMIPALKDMVNAAYTRQTITRSRLPDMILIMLYVISITCVFIEGYSSTFVKAKERVFLFGFALISTFVVYIILDYDRPYRGLITDRIGEEAMVEKRKLFEEQ